MMVGAEDRTNLISSEKDWYKIFISIVFGVFISVWISPFFELHSTEFSSSLICSSEVLSSDNDREKSVSFECTQKNAKATLGEVINSLHRVEYLRGIIMFSILVCLWWWYGPFLSEIMPARSFLGFFYDFASLCLYAIAFRAWTQEALFSLTVTVAAMFMFIRFSACLILLNYGRFDYPKSGSRAKAAIILAVGVLFVFILLSIAFISGTLANGNIPETLIHTVVMVFLLVGIFTTVIAVKVTEGLSLREGPRPAYQWKETDAGFHFFSPKTW